MKTAVKVKPIVRSDGYVIALVNRKEVLTSLQEEIRWLILRFMKDAKETP